MRPSKRRFTFRLFLASLLAMYILSFGAAAGEWQKDEARGWWYLNEDRTYPANGWMEIGGRLYYFDADGYMLSGVTTPDGFQVGTDGARLDPGGQPVAAGADTVILNKAGIKSLTAVTGANVNAASTLGSVVGTNVSAAGTQSGGIGGANVSTGGTQSNSTSGNGAAAQNAGSSTSTAQVQSSAASVASAGTSYVLNTNTKKFHYPSCSSVSQMKDKNKRYSQEDRDAIIAKGYDPCKKCKP